MKLKVHDDGDFRIRRTFAFAPVRLYNQKQRVWLERVWVLEKYVIASSLEGWIPKAYWQGKKDDGPKLVF